MLKASVPTVFGKILEMQPDVDECCETLPMSGAPAPMRQDYRYTIFACMSEKFTDTRMFEGSLVGFVDTTKGDLPSADYKSSNDAL